MLANDPQKLTAADLKAQQAACWILGMYSAFDERGWPTRMRGQNFDKREFRANLRTALELVRYGCTWRGPIVLSALIDYVERMAPRFHTPLWGDEAARD